MTNTRPHLDPLRSAAARILTALCALLFAAPAVGRADAPVTSPSRSGVPMKTTSGTVRIGYLHHSTGQAVWRGGVPEFIRAWNKDHRTDYQITSVTYPATDAGLPPIIRKMADTYPWANYPYDYWNLWVEHTGKSRDRGELNLDDLTAKYDVIVFKHCFPVSRVKPDDGAPSIASKEKTIANYKLQYEAIKARLHQFPNVRFIVWTGAALPEASTNPDDAKRARSFFEWVKNTWDERGDNIFVWDFHELETEGGLYLKNDYATTPRDAHPSKAFSKRVAPLIGQRIVDVIEGRGDSTSLTGRTETAGNERRIAP